MFIVTVLESNRVIRKETFRNEDCAWAYHYSMCNDKYKVIFENLSNKNWRVIAN